MNARIAKQFVFAAAHQLMNHDGKCRDLHGHTYKAEICVSGRINDTVGDPKEGMVLDFNDLKATWASEVEPLVDHKNLNDTLPVPVTSSEHIALWILGVFHSHHVEVCMVRLWESPTSYAEVTLGDLIKP